MPLLVHFHAPLYPQRSWESFHSRWANSIADALQLALPARYFAEVQMHLGSQVEADVELETALPTSNGANGGLAVATWSPPAATLIVPAVFPDELGVEVRDKLDDARVVAVVELIKLDRRQRCLKRRQLG